MKHKNVSEFATMTSGKSAKHSLFPCAGRQLIQINQIGSLIEATLWHNGGVSSSS